MADDRRVVGHLLGRRTAGASIAATLMRTVGIVGGIAPASTIDYYRLLIERYRQRRQDGSYPSILINSIDLQEFLKLVATGDRGKLSQFLLDEVRKLAHGGADFALFASNTPHLVFDEVERQSPIPLVSIVEATAAVAAVEGYRKIGLLGTRFTMEGGFYSTVFDRRGIGIVLPNAEDRSYVHERYFTELVGGVFKRETSQGILAVVDRMRTEHGIDAVILGGTELPPLFREHPEAGLPMLDTTAIHVDSAIERMTPRDS